MSSKLETNSWAARRRVWIEFMFAGPFSLAYINESQTQRDAHIEFRSFHSEHLCRVCGDGDKWGLSDAGRVLRVLYMLADKEAGPWTVTQIRQFADMKRLTADEVTTGLDVLTIHKIVVRQPSARTTKWDLK